MKEQDPLTAYFESDDLCQIIINELRLAKESIKIAVCWFTNKTIFDELLDILDSKKKSKRNNPSIEIITTRDEINCCPGKLEFQKFIEDGDLYFYKGKGLMHHKFCIIDNLILLTGSCNWTFENHNKENIVILRGCDKLIEKFDTVFKGLKELSGDKVAQYTPLPDSLCQDINNKRLDIDATVASIIQKENNYSTVPAAERSRTVNGPYGLQSANTTLGTNLIRTMYLKDNIFFKYDDSDRYNLIFKVNQEIPTEVISLEGKNGEDNQPELTIKLYYGANEKTPLWITIPIPHIYKCLKGTLRITFKFSIDNVGLLHIGTFFNDKGPYEPRILNLISFDLIQ